MGSVFYFTYYDINDSNEDRLAFLPCINKGDSIINSLNNIGYDVKIISYSRTSSKKYYPARKTRLGRNTLQMFATLPNYNSIFKAFSVFFIIVQALLYTFRNIKKNDIIIIYHSLGNMWTSKLLKLCGYRKVVYEIEEIYGDVIKSGRIKKKELNSFKNAVAYIFPTVLLNKIINKSNKPYCVIHGTYKVEKDRNKRIFDKEHIHCVYAGTFDPRKGGGYAAIAAAAFLPEIYHMHIIGFGSKDEIENIQKLISEISKKTEATVTYDGLKSGEEYIEFIQSCDIGLSTQNPNAAFNATSFPSKVLSYLANGLHVVSIKIPAIEGSKVGDMLYYYEKQAPEDIANAIMSVDLSVDFDSRKLIQKLNEEFEKDFSMLMRNLK